MSYQAKERPFKKLAHLFRREIGDRLDYFGSLEEGEELILREDPEGDEGDLQLLERSSKGDPYRTVARLRPRKGRQDEIHVGDGSDGQRLLVVPNRYETPGDLIVLVRR